MDGLCALSSAEVFEHIRRNPIVGRMTVYVRTLDSAATCDLHEVRAIRVLGEHRLMLKFVEPVCVSINDSLHELTPYIYIHPPGDYTEYWCGADFNPSIRPVWMELTAEHIGIKIKVSINLLMEKSVTRA